MSASDILERLHRGGLQVRRDGDRVLLAPREKVTPDVLTLVRLNKPALLQELVAEAARDSRRQQAIDMLQHAEARRITAVAGEPTGEQVSVMVAIRTAGHGIITGELFIPAGRWDPWLFLRYLQEQDGRPA